MPERKLQFVLIVAVVCHKYDIIWILWKYGMLNMNEYITIPLQLLCQWQWWWLMLVHIIYFSLITYDLFAKEGEAADDNHTCQDLFKLILSIFYQLLQFQHSTGSFSDPVK